MEVHYDLSRLMERATASAPSGIDRVDLRYALWTREQASAWVGLLQRPEGLSVVDTDTVNNLLTSLRQRWIEGAPLGVVDDVAWVRPEFWELETKRSILEKAACVGLWERLEGRRLLEWPFYVQPKWSMRLLSLRRKPTRVGGVLDPQGSYWNIGHNFRFEKAAAEISATFGASSVIFLHDVIPLLYPETQRAVSRQHFRRFCKWVDQLNGQFIVSSQSTLADVAQLRGRGMDLFGSQLDRVIQLPLPVEASFVGGDASHPVPVSDDPYFLILGAWEPRKNFELLLDVWEQLVAAGGSPIILKWVGRRGELSRRSAARLKRLERAGWVEVLGVVSDQTIEGFFCGARALLFPSLAEGWGLPLAEALASGLPVIASDCSVCREVSQGLAEYRDPLDTELWLLSVQKYSGADSAARQEQLERIRNFQWPTWGLYFGRLLEALRDD